MEVAGGRWKRGCGDGTEWMSNARGDGCGDGVSLPSLKSAAAMEHFSSRSSHVATVGGAGSGWQSSAVVVDVVVMNTGVGRWQRGCRNGSFLGV